jgi:hypothetical protein
MHFRFNAIENTNDTEQEVCTSNIPADSEAYL